jgi:hypothetical protein
VIEARALLKSFKPREGSDEAPADDGRNAEAAFHGKSRRDPCLDNRSRWSALPQGAGFIGHGLMKNGDYLLVNASDYLLVNASLAQADGHPSGWPRSP